MEKFYEIICKNANNVMYQRGEEKSFSCSEEKLLETMCELFKKGWIIVRIK